MHRLGDPLVILLGLSLLASLLALGSVHRLSLLLIAPLGLAAGTLALLRARTLPPLAIVPLALAGYTLLQAVPLPLSWVEALSPRAAELWSRSTYVFGEEAPRYAPLSLDPGATISAALTWVLYGFVTLASFHVARSRGPRPVIWMVFLCAVIAAVTTLTHGLLSADKVFGVYEPSFETNRWNVGPLLNPNNLSGYLNLGILCGIGLVTTRSSVPYHWGVALAIAVLIGVNAQAASRAGLVSFVVGVVLFCVTLLATRNSMRRAPTAGRVGAGLAIFAVGGGVALGAISAADKTSKALADEGLEKLEIIEWTAPMIRDFPWFGVGRGAYETVSPGYRQHGGNVVVSHPENFLAQWASEWGLPVAGATLLAMVFLARPGRLAIRSSPATLGAAFAMVTLVAQNLVDLGLEVPAVMLALLALLGGLRGGAALERPRVRRSLVWGVLAFAVLVGGLALTFGRHAAIADRDAIHRKYSALDPKDPAALSAFVSDLRAATLRHPADPYFPLLGGLATHRAGRADALSWLSRSLDLDPNRARTHFAVANVLATKGAISQALLHIRLASELEPRLAGDFAAAAPLWTKDYDTLLRGAPAAPGGADSLVGMARTLSARQHATVRSRLLTEAVKRDPEHLKARIELARTLQEAIRRDDPRCSGDQREECLKDLEGQARRLHDKNPTSEVPIGMIAEVHFERGEADRAIEWLGLQCPRIGNSTRCLRLRVRAELLRGDENGIKVATRALENMACTSDDACAKNAEWLGTQLLRAGRLPAAVSAYTKAARRAPTRARWVRVGVAAEHMGARALAERAFEHASRYPGGDVESITRRYRKELARLVPEEDRR